MEQLDLEKWSSNNMHTQLTIPYVELLNIDNMTQKIVNNISEPITKKLAIYVRNNNKLYKLKDVEYNLYNIKYLLDLSGDIKLNVNGNERYIKIEPGKNYMKEVLKEYGYNDDTNDTVSSSDVDNNGSNSTEVLYDLFK